MSGITLQWLLSGLMSDGMKREGNFREADAAASGKDIMTDGAMSETVLLGVMILAAVLLAICLVLLLIRLLGRRQRHRTARVSSLNAGSITQELPVAEVQAALRPVKVLKDIVYCESEEIIP